VESQFIKDGIFATARDSFDTAVILRKNYVYYDVIISEIFLNRTQTSKFNLTSLG